MYKIETVIDYDNIVEFNLYDKATEIAINSKNVKFVDSHKNHDGVCFNYALEDKHGFIGSCEEAYTKLKKEYKQINISKAKKGDIISYHEIGEESFYGNDVHEYNALHFAIIKKTKGTLNSTIIKSKWGNDGVFETNLYDIPDCYGNAIVIWRKNKNN